jgi:hypothetical protein
LHAINEACKQRLIVCGGLQSGGTTIVSWCFLQRGDTDGMLDMRNDILATSFPSATAPVLWVKITIGSFRLCELIAIYRDMGWNTQPLLIVRDVRSAYSSLKTKPYGFNGTTAQEPPLMIRFLRFLEDWRAFRDLGWPILKFEDFLLDPRLELTSLCHELQLEWDEAMISWPKPLSSIAYVGTPNRTFAESIVRGSASAALDREKSATRVEGLLPREQDWLEQTFAEFNAYHGYPSHVPYCIGIHDEYASPRFVGTRRQRTRDAIDWLKSVIDVDLVTTLLRGQDSTSDTSEQAEVASGQIVLKKLRDALQSVSRADGLDGMLE